MGSTEENPRSKIRRWGKGLGVHLPRAVLARAKLSEGMIVKVENTLQGILLTPERDLRPKRKHTLRKLCKGMTPAKSHPEFKWGGAAGSEI